ncbi:hypothetical protein, partial [Streptomyces yangpuensis]
SPEEVPQLLPQAWFDDHLAYLIDHMQQVNSSTVRHLRRAASLKLMEMTAGGTWAECAKTLGTLRGSVVSTFDALGRRCPEICGRSSKPASNGSMPNSTATPTESTTHDVVNP